MQYFVSDREITLYWDKPEKLPEAYGFCIYVNGNFVETCSKTHYTIRNLHPDTGYDVRVTLNEAFLIGSLYIRTGKVKNRLDITKYGAVGDGVTMNTAVIQNVLDACTKDDVVYIPEGIFMTGALRLHSDMELYLEEGAVLQGTDRLEDYLPKIWSRFEGMELYCYSSFLNMGVLDHDAGYNCRNVVIHGKGTIASGGAKLAHHVMEKEREALKDYIASLGSEIDTYENMDTIPGRVRPRLINMSNCQNIRISGVTLKNGACWNVHMIYSDHIVTNGCTFHSEEVWNGDGWDPDSSTNCTIFDCKFYTRDDSIAIKSGKNPEGNIVNRPTEHIRIFDCDCAYGHGFAMGSEMSGGIRDVRIWDCTMDDAVYGVEIKGTKKRGGYVKDIHVRDSKITRIMMHAVGYNDDGIGAEHPPVFCDCSFKNLHLTGTYCWKNERKFCKAVEVSGFEEPGYEVKNVELENLLIDEYGDGVTGTMELKYCEGISMKNIRVRRLDRPE